MLSVNTNTSALYAQQSLQTNARGLASVMTQMSTGRRINSASDDPAGLAISTRLASQIRGLNQALRNSNDGISLLQTAERASEQVTNMLQRMRELSIQAGNDTNNDNDRKFLDLEYQQLKLEVNRIGTTTQYSGANLLNGLGGNGSGAFKFQVGANANQSISIQLPNLQTEPALDETQSLCKSYSYDIHTISTGGANVTLPGVGSVSSYIDGVNITNTTDLGNDLANKLNKILGDLNPLPRVAYAAGKLTFSPISDASPLAGTISIHTLTPASAATPSTINNTVTPNVNGTMSGGSAGHQPQLTADFGPALNGLSSANAQHQLGNTITTTIQGRATTYQITQSDINNYGGTLGNRVAAGLAAVYNAQPPFLVLMLRF